jgi:mannan endo-1,4-beta-mannosidase
VVIGFGHEMNAPWYSWGYKNVKATTFVAAWRHIVTLFRAEGADNVTWLWTINRDTQGTGPIAQWWPGKAYVTWVGIDGYYTKPNDTFSSVFGRTINQVRRITNEPILLSETAVSPRTVRFAKITDLFRGLAQNRMLGLVWFDMQSDTGVLKEDWQIEGNRPAENAFRHGASNLNLVKP